MKGNLKNFELVKQKEQKRAKNQHAKYEYWQRIGLIYIVYHFIGIDQVIYRNEIKATFKFLPKCNFGKKGKNNDEKSNKKTYVSNNSV